MSERDEGLSARDAELLDSLYRATPGPSDEDAELEQFQQLRSVFAELKAHQDEPPPAGMALLMAAARQAAEERRPAGLWARLRAGWSAMLAHPAMSAVAAAVVVVGIGGYLVARGVTPAAEQAPSVSRAREAAPGASSSATTAPAAPGSGAAPVEVPAAAAPAPALERSSRIEADSELKERAPKRHPAPKDATGVVTGTKKKLEAPTEEGGEQSLPSAPKVQEQWSSTPAEPPPAPEEEEAAPRSSAGSAKAPGTASKAAPPSPVKRADSPADRTLDASTPEREKGASGRGAGPSAGLEQEDRDAQNEDTPSRAQRWYELAKAAAAKGDCEAVKLFGTRIKSEAPAFYDARFRKDAAIAKCL